MSAWTRLMEPGPALIFLILVILPQVAYSAPLDNEDVTEIQYYPVADATGCYYNFEHYDEGDRIITNEPCLNCTCHNRMLMCYLRVCPFTKAIGQNCKVEKKADQCCPVITCPEVPVQVSHDASTTPSTAVGHLNEYGCSIDNLFYADGAKVPSNPDNPCEVCYCIRNKTACIIQECTLTGRVVEGCRPVYLEGVCCPLRYDCDHPEIETTPRPLLTTTTASPTTLLPTTTLSSSHCNYNNEMYADGALVKKDVPCEKCYCMRGDIVCAVQECGPTPLDKVNCTALPIKKGQCCPDTYNCDKISEEDLTTISSYIPTTQPTIVTRDEELTTESESEASTNQTSLGPIPKVEDRNQFSTAAEETSTSTVEDLNKVTPKSSDITTQGLTSAVTGAITDLVESITTALYGNTETENPVTTEESVKETTVTPSKKEPSETSQQTESPAESTTGLPAQTTEGKPESTSHDRNGEPEITESSTPLPGSEDAHTRPIDQQHETELPSTKVPETESDTADTEKPKEGVMRQQEITTPKAIIAETTLQPAVSEGEQTTINEQEITTEEESEPTEEPKTTEESKETEDSKPTEVPQSTKEPKEKEEFKPTEESKTEETKLTEKPKVTEDSKSTDEPKQTEEVKPTEGPKVTEESKSTEEPKETEEFKPTVEPTETEESKPTEEPKESEKSKSTEEPKESEESKPTEEPKESEESKPTEEPKETDESKPTVEPTGTEESKPTEESKETDESKPTIQPTETEEPKVTEGSEIPEESKPTEQPKETEGSKSTEEPNETEESKPTEEPKEKDGSKPTEKPTKTEESKPTDAPKSTEEPKETEVPKSTEESKQTEGPIVTELATSTEGPKETEGSKKTEQPKETQHPIEVTEKEIEATTTEEIEIVTSGPANETEKPLSMDHVSESGSTKTTEEKTETPVHIPTLADRFPEEDTTAKANETTSKIEEPTKLPPTKESNEIPEVSEECTKESCKPVEAQPGKETDHTESNQIPEGPIKETEKPEVATGTAVPGLSDGVTTEKTEETTIRAKSEETSTEIKLEESTTPSQEPEKSETNTTESSQETSQTESPKEDKKESTTPHDVKENEISTDKEGPIEPNVTEKQTPEEKVVTITPQYETTESGHDRTKGSAETSTAENITKHEEGETKVTTEVSPEDQTTVIPEIPPRINIPDAEKTTSVEVTTVAQEKVKPSEESIVTTTELSSQETESTPEEERIHGIPGEGSCLVEGKTFSNNSAVPVYNHCQASCRCASSIVRCKDIICPEPPKDCELITPKPRGTCCPAWSCPNIPEVTSGIESSSQTIDTTTAEEEGSGSSQTEKPEGETQGGTAELTTSIGETFGETEVTTSAASQTEKEAGVTEPKQGINETPSGPQETTTESSDTSIPPKHDESINEIQTPEETCTKEGCVRPEATPGKPSESEKSTEASATSEPTKNTEQPATPIENKITEKQIEHATEEIKPTEEQSTTPSKPETTKTEKEETTTLQTEITVGEKLPEGATAEPDSLPKETTEHKVTESITEQTSVNEQTEDTNSVTTERSPEVATELPTSKPSLEDRFKPAEKGETSTETEEPEHQSKIPEPTEKIEIPSATPSIETKPEQEASTETSTPLVTELDENKQSELTTEPIEHVTETGEPGVSKPIESANHVTEAKAEGETTSIPLIETKPKETEEAVTDSEKQPAEVTTLAGVMRNKDLETTTIKKEEQKAENAQPEITTEKKTEEIEVDVTTVEIPKEKLATEMPKITTEGSSVAETTEPVTISDRLPEIVTEGSTKEQTEPETNRETTTPSVKQETEISEKSTEQSVTKLEKETEVNTTTKEESSEITVEGTTHLSKETETPEHVTKVIPSTATEEQPIEKSTSEPEGITQGEPSTEAPSVEEKLSEKTVKPLASVENATEPSGTTPAIKSEEEASTLETITDIPSKSSVTEVSQPEETSKSSTPDVQLVEVDSTPGLASVTEQSSDVTTEGKTPDEVTEVTTEQKVPEETKVSEETTEKQTPKVSTEEKTTEETTEKKAPEVVTEDRAPEVTTEERVTKQGEETTDKNASEVTTDEKAPEVTTEEKAPEVTKESISEVTTEEKDETSSKPASETTKPFEEIGTTPVGGILVGDRLSPEVGANATTPKEEEIFTSPQLSTESPKNESELFTSGLHELSTTRSQVEGELSTSHPLFHSTEVPTTPEPEHHQEIPGEHEHVPEVPFPGEDYDEDEEPSQLGPGTCRYGGKVFVSAQQIPRDDPCDFCFCFRSDIICLQQSCPPPIPNCHEEPIRGFCCPRYECPVSMAASLNVSTTTTTTTTTLPPHFLAHVRDRATRTGCQIDGRAYKVGEYIRSASGPCMHCTCGGDGQMKCDPKQCSPEPMLRQMIAAASRRRR